MIENYFDPLYEVYTEHAFYRWILCAIVAIALTFVLKLMQKALASSLRKWTGQTRLTWDDVGVDLLERVRALVIVVVVFFLLTRPLDQSTGTHKLLQILVVIALVYQFIIWGFHLIKKWHESFLEKKIKESPSSAAAIGLIYTGVQIVFLTLIVLIGLSNVGVDITALIAGLGVGGIAVALAAQNVLGDLLASLSIVFDKPFVVGDFIVAGEQTGTVENIGIKTTRLRALSGEQLVLSNKDLLESRIQNYKRMQIRRVVQRFGVVYSTRAEVLAQIPNWVKGIVEAQERLQFDRCHFFSYGASSLDFELVFFVKSAEYNVYMDSQQIVLLEINKKFAQEKVEFAFPSLSVYVEKNQPSN